MKIDAHQHFWLTARADYGWLTPDSGPLWRDFMPTDLAPLLSRHGIDRTILVQAAPTEAETLFLLDIAARTDTVAAVVGWTDLLAPDSAQRIGKLAGLPKLRGLRPMLQDIADRDWIARPALAPALGAMAAHGLVFDALVLPCHLPPLLTMVTRHPDLAVVIDHGAKPVLAGGSLDAWRADLAVLAARPNVTCKLSGLVTEAGPAWAIADLRPVFDHLLARFGPARLIWGSDWPVVTLAASYDRWHETALELCAALSVPERDAIFGGTAARIYLQQAGGPSPC